MVQNVATKEGRFVRYGSLALGMVGMLLAGYGAWIAAFGPLDRGSLLMAAGLLFFFVGTIDRFEELTGLGLKAK